MWVYEADKVVSGEAKLVVNTDSEIELKYDGRLKKLSSLRAAWFRHPDLLNLALDDKAKQLCIEQEVSALQESFWLEVPENVWLNDPSKMKATQAKLAQLAIASRLGFTTPKTIVSNDWLSIGELLDSDSMIIKMSRGILYENNKAKVLYTTVLDKQKRELIKHASAFPGIYQPFINKGREWRITVVGDEVFQAAIYTSEEAKDDWRRHQLTPKVQFKKESMPEIEIERCIEFLKQAGLTYGAFDFIEDEEGKIIFLECNSNGQYRWLEDLLEFPISEAIAGTLIRIYENSHS